MRWFWFATFTLICSLLSIFFRQPLILIAELFLIDIFLTRKVKWLFWIPKSAKRFPPWLNFSCWLLFTIWIIRVLAIDSITIVTSAGKPQLQPGDNVIVSKIHYGPRLPQVPFISQKSYHRLAGLSGLSAIKRGDLLAFNFPEGDSVLEDMASISYYSWKRKNESKNPNFSTPTKVRFRPLGRRSPEISRCAGLPGDTVIIPSAASSSLQISYDYLIEVRNQQLPQDFVDKLGLGATETQILPGLGYLIPLRPDQLAFVRLRPEVNSLAAHMMEPGKGDYNIFPHDNRYPWNRDNFGPVIVPQKGDLIRLTIPNLCIYRRIIEVYEKNLLEVRQDLII